MNETYRVDESTAFELAPSLKNYVSKLPDDAVHHDYLVVTCVVLAAETNFSLLESTTDPSRLENTIPPGKNLELGNYEVTFQFDLIPDIKCRLVGCTTGDILLLNFYPLTKVRQSYSIAIQTLKYVNPYSSDLSCRFRNLKDLSIRIKESLFLPLRTNLLTDAGIMHNYFAGLPVELKLKILEYLNVVSLLRISECNKEFYELSQTSCLWENLMKRHFHQKSCDLNGFKNNFRRYYWILQASKKQKRCVRYR